MNTYSKAVKLGVIHSPFWPGKPSGISEEDLIIWNRFRDSYNVTNSERVYFGTKLNSETNETIALDVVLEYPHKWIIVEFANKVTNDVIDHLVTCRKIWNSDPPDSKPVFLMVATEKFDHELLV